MKVVVAAGGRFHSFHLAHQLQRYDILQGIYTASYAVGDEQLVKPEKIFYNRMVGVCDQLYNRLGGRFVMAPTKWYSIKDRWFDDWFSEQLSAADAPDAVVGWAHYVDHSVNAIKQRGSKLILESGSMHIVAQQELLKEEYERWGRKFTPITAEHRDCMLREYDQADAISVPSTHVRDSFIQQGIDAKKLIVTPYGVDYESFYVSRTEPAQKFRVIFVGMVSVRKGIGDLLNAWNLARLPHSAELIIVGSMLDRFDDIYTHPSIKYVGPVQQSTLRDWYASASLLVLPSIEEGLSMVMAEAMSAGLPVLCTPLTGGKDLFTDGKHGFIVPERNASALAEKISWAFAHQEDLLNMGLAAQQHIKKNTWNTYGKKIIKHYEKIILGE